MCQDGWSCQHGPQWGRWRYLVPPPLPITGMCSFVSPKRYKDGYHMQVLPKSRFSWTLYCTSKKSCSILVLSSSFSMITS